MGAGNRTIGVVRDEYFGKIKEPRLSLGDFVKISMRVSFWLVVSVL